MRLHEQGRSRILATEFLMQKNLMGTHQSPRDGEQMPSDEEEKHRQVALQNVGAQLLDGPNSRGILISGWKILSKKCPILNMQSVEQWEKMLETSHLPEMVFGDSSLELVHKASGIHISFNAFDALCGWKREGLPPVEVPAAAKWKFRSKPSQEVILDYDYTFTTPYCGSETIEHSNNGENTKMKDGLKLEWEECGDRIDLVALQARDPILFYDEVVLYEDELSDNGVSLLTVKVRVMPKCWFLLLRYWLRVDGVLMRLRDTRMHSNFHNDDSVSPTVLRERCIRENKIQDLVARGLLVGLPADNDGSFICDRLQVQEQHTEKLAMKGL